MPSLTLDNESAVFAYLNVFLDKAPAVNLARTIVHLQRHHGLEWTVQYLKEMKVNFRSQFLESPQTRSRETTPKGSFKPVWKLSLRDGLQLLNIYTCVRLKNPTRQQMLKFVNAVKSPKRDIHRNFVEPRILSEATVIFPCLRWKHPYMWIRSPGKRTPHFDDGELVTVAETELSFNDVVADLYSLDDATKAMVRKYRRLYAAALWVTPISVVSYMQGPRRAIYDHSGLVCWDTTSCEPLAGKLGFIQEKGGKLRVVANTFRFHQMALSPLGDWLFSVLKRLPWDCTFDQDRGRSYVKQELSSGKKLFCYDLSNATDKFPLSVQVDLVKALINTMKSRERIAPSTEIDSDETAVTIDQVEQSLELFVLLARGEWESKPLVALDPSLTTIRWTQGQPLGLYPSFALFALAHGNMVRDIERQCNTLDTFRIVGDDIVISDEKVALMYRAQMESWGCEISESKSVISDQIGEFAGKTITRKGVVETVKWSDFSKKDPTGPMRVLGYNGLPFVPPSFRKKVALYCALPDPVSLGLNPRGLSLEQRMVPEVLSWFYPKRYKVLTDIRLSYSDRKARLDDALGRMLPLCKQVTVWKSQSLPRDQRDSNVDFTTIEHFNAVVNGLESYEDLPELVQVPTIEDRLPTRSNPFEDGQHSGILLRIYKYFRSFKRNSTQH